MENMKTITLKDNTSQTVVTFSIIGKDIYAFTKKAKVKVNIHTGCGCCDPTVNQMLDMHVTNLLKTGHFSVMNATTDGVNEIYMAIYHGIDHMPAEQANPSVEELKTAKSVLDSLEKGAPSVEDQAKKLREIFESGNLPEKLKDHPLSQLFMGLFGALDATSQKEEVEPKQKTESKPVSLAKPTKVVENGESLMDLVTDYLAKGHSEAVIRSTLRKHPTKAFTEREITQTLDAIAQAKVNSQPEQELNLAGHVSGAMSCGHTEDQIRSFLKKHYSSFSEAEVDKVFVAYHKNSPVTTPETVTTVLVNDGKSYATFDYAVGQVNFDLVHAFAATDHNDGFVELAEVGGTQVMVTKSDFEDYFFEVLVQKTNQSLEQLRKAHPSITNDVDLKRESLIYRGFKLRADMLMHTAGDIVQIVHTDDLNVSLIYNGEQLVRMITLDWGE